MKKIVFLVLIMVAMLSVAKAATITRTMSGGGPFGYQTVTETTNTETGDKTITCQGMGWTQCPLAATGAANIPIGVQQELFGYADSQIASNILSGTYTSNGYTVTWTATSSTEADMTITTAEGCQNCGN